MNVIIIPGNKLPIFFDSSRVNFKSVKFIDKSMTTKLKTKPRAITLLSGGIDSAVSSVYAHLDYRVTPIFFKYGQIAEGKEIFCVRKLTKIFGFEQPIIMNLPWLRTIGYSSGLINKEVQLRNQKEWVREYVPFRNTIFLSIAIAIAESRGIDAVFIGSTATDRICPDNRPSYIKAFQKVVYLGTKLKTDIKIIAPLSNKSKTQVVKFGHEFGVPFEFTWSCHKSAKQACGRCSNCTSRLQAFKNNHLKDPIYYEKSDIDN